MGKRRVYRNKKELIANHVRPTDTVLDVGFWGQGITQTDTQWPHKLLKDTGASIYGIDIAINRSLFPDESHYKEASAEDFSFPDTRFDVIFAGDLIEHLINPGQFLERCRDHLTEKGYLILTTPNTFNLFNIAGKLTNDEPAVNADHTFYFNHKTLRTLLKKCHFAVEQIDYLYTLEYSYKESSRKKALNGLYRVLSWFTPKFTETLVIVARPI